MFQSLYNFAKDRNLEIRSKTREKKRIKARIVIEDGKWMPKETEDCKNELFLCPSIGTLNRTRACIICEKAGVILYGAKTEEDGKEKIFGEQFRAKHQDYIKTTKEGAEYSKTLRVISDFLEKTENDEEFRQEVFNSLRDFKIKATSLISFKIDNVYAENTSDWCEWFDTWFERLTGNKPAADIAVSAVSGKPVLPLTGPFPKVGSMAETPIASFDKSAFTSYGFKGSANLPVSEEEAYTVKSALDYLLENDANHSRDFGIAFWFERKADEAEKMLADYFKAEADEKNDGEYQEDEFADSGITGQDKKIAEKRYGEALHSRTGKKASPSSTEEDNVFHVMRYENPKSRLCLPEEYRESYSKLYEAIRKWESDTALPAPLYEKDGTVAGRQNRGIRHALTILSDLLWKTDTKDRAGQIKAEYGADRIRLFKAICFGDDIPEIFYLRALRKIRTLMAKGKSDDGVQRKKDRRAFKTSIAVIKAWLIRNGGEEMLKPELEKEIRHKAYLLGRLIAVVEKMQKDSSGREIRKTIADHYFEAMIQRPMEMVYRLKKYASVYSGRMKAGGNIGSAVYYDNILNEIMEGFGEELPDAMSKKDAGMASIGYYQQRGELYKKKETDQASITHV